MNDEYMFFEPMQMVTADKNFVYLEGLYVVDEDNDHNAYIKMPREVYMKVIQEYMDGYARYFKNIRCYAGHSMCVLDNVKDTGIVSVSRRVVDADSPECVTTDWKVYEWVDGQSNYHVEFEHG